MSPTDAVRMFLDREAMALRTRIDRLLPFSATLTMVPAASISMSAMHAIERHLRSGRDVLRGAVQRFRGWLASPAGRRASGADAQRRFTILKLRFDAIISQFDIFADVLVQRSEHGTGVWIAGLDDLATDAMQIPYYRGETPPMVCYLDRGHGAAIRRARTRLPGGELSPVAIVRVPRERMVGQGIGASLIHEVGHQVAAMLDLVNPLRMQLQDQQRRATPEARAAWICWERWISEIVADFWAVAKLGVGATLGLIGVVSLPKVFVFRVDLDDPHPVPWMRVMVSLAVGKALYPHPQWGVVERMWKQMYPPTELQPEQAALLMLLERSLPEFARLLVRFQPTALRGQTLGEAARGADRTPRQLQAAWDRFRLAPDRWHTLPPTLAFAAISQARSEGRLTPAGESRLISRLLLEWAVKSALEPQTKFGKTNLKSTTTAKPFPYVSPNASSARLGGQALSVR